GTVIRDEINGKKVTSARLVTMAGIRVLNTAAEVQGLGQITFGTLALFAGNESNTVDVGPEPITDTDAIKDTLRAIGMTDKGVTLADAMFNFADATTNLQLLVRKGQGQFVPITLEDAKRSEFNDVIACFHSTNNNSNCSVAVFSPERKHTGEFCGSLIGGSSKTAIRTVDMFGNITTQDFTASSKSGAWIVLKVFGAGFMSSAAGIIIGLFTALTFSWVAFTIALILIFLGVGAGLIYEWQAGNPM
ncbi:MAG: hypothetical protein LBH53_01395, partial [Puniceicoccales bacterium]|nr:hypothetical protein [Puniceicoccales bacterium]